MVEAQPGAVDLLVIGAGPAGARAALRAQACGLGVLLVDENPDAGGQVWRPLPPGFARAAGRSTLHRGRSRATPCGPNCVGAGMRCLFGHKVWNVGRSLRTDLIGPDGVMQLAAARLARRHRHDRARHSFRRLDPARRHRPGCGHDPASSRRTCCPVVARWSPAAAHCCWRSRTASSRPAAKWLRCWTWPAGPIGCGPCPRWPRRPDLLWHGVQWQLALRKARRAAALSPRHRVGRSALGDGFRHSRSAGRHATGAPIVAHLRL